VIYADHEGDPQKGRAEAERLISQQKAAALIDTYHSAVAATVSQTAERYAVPFMSADNSSPSLHRRGLKFFFRAAAHDVMFSDVMFDFFDVLRKNGRRSRYRPCSMKIRYSAQIPRIRRSSSRANAATRSLPILSTAQTRRR
jgi:hypothetical protein